MTRNVTKAPAKSILKNKIGNFVVAAFLCLFITSNSYANLLSADEFETKSSISKLSHKLHIHRDDAIAIDKQKQGDFVGYSHKFSQMLGMDLSVDTYLSSNQSDNSFKWVVGVVTDLFKVQYETDHTTTREHLELTSSYPLNKSLSLRGYVGNKQDGKDEYKDYSVGIAYSLNQSIELSVGYADQELKEVETQSNVFLNINGVF